MSEKVWDAGATGLDHAALAQWYCQVLGLQPLFDNAREPATILVGGPGGAMIEIMPDNREARPERAFYAPGISHLALRVTDFDAAYAFLQSHGVQLAPP